MHVLLTGVAGFIGYHCAQRLLKDGHAVTGIDNLNSYYDVKLKEARLARLQGHKDFRFVKQDISVPGLPRILEHEAGNGVTHVLHLAAQAGVRHSLENPRAYLDSNLAGPLGILEYARANKMTHVVYASSSSVYGGNTKTPFSVKDPVEHPVSLYAATKRGGELMAETYAHLFAIPLTGLRFFTVYGPWGRPDMAAYLFCRKIIDNAPIPVFNHGDMQRDFTYIDDIVDGVMGALARAPKAGDGKAPHNIYNLGNAHPEKLTDFIAGIERCLGKKAAYDFKPMQPGDVPVTSADITESTRDFGFQPRVNIAEGLERFVAWFREYHKVA